MLPTKEHPIDVDTPDDPYADALSGADRAIYLAASADTDLSHEIRLIRTLLRKLTRYPLKNAPLIKEYLTMLNRAAYIQARLNGAVGDLESALLFAANAELDDPTAPPQEDPHLAL